MPQPTIWGRVLALAAIVMCTAFALSASGDQKADSPFAIIDVQKLMNEFNARKAAEAEVVALGNKHMERLKRRDGMPFLAEADQANLDELYEKANRTEADNNKIKEIEKKNKDKVDEVQAIRQKASPTEADKKKLEDADKTFREAGGRFAQIKDDLDAKLKALEKAKLDVLDKKLKDSVAKVAQQKGLSIVFTSQVALYAGTDITDAVVGEINKK